jgi:hypothetical protein
MSLRFTAIIIIVLFIQVESTTVTVLYYFAQLLIHIVGEGGKNPKEKANYPSGISIN